MSTNQKLLLICISGFTVRIIFILFFSDLENPQMWEFGIIARNLLEGKGFQYDALTTSVPSAYMPPGLPFIYFLFFQVFGDGYTAFLLILIISSIIAVLTIYYSFILARMLFTETIGIYTAAYVAFSPIIIFSTMQFNSVVHYHILISLIILLILKITDNTSLAKHIDFFKKYKYALSLGILFGIFLYFRSEMLGLLILTAAYFLYKRRTPDAIIIVITAFLFILPWSVRNYNTFGKVMPITSSMGYNFYLGHGDEATTYEYKERLSLLTEDSTFELQKSKISLDIAKRYIVNNPANEVIESAKKVFSLWVADLYRPQAKEALYLIIWIPTLMLFLYGSFISLKDQAMRTKLTFIYLYFIFSTSIVLIFFNIPRYQIQMSIIMLPIAMYGLSNFITSIKNRR